MTEAVVTVKNGVRRIDLRAAVAQRDVKASQASSITFGELCRAYLAAHYSGADMQLRKWLDLLADRNAWEITTAELADALQAMIENGYAPATVNRNASQLGSVYKWAQKARRIAPAGFISPTKALPRFIEAIRRVELSDDEVSRLIASSAAVRDRRFTALVRLLVETGARRGEVLNRRWRDIDLNKKTITCDTTKTGAPRILRFSDETAALMARVWTGSRAPDDMLFGSARAPGKPIDFKKHWASLTASIGRTDLRLHDLRHYRAKKMIASGASLSVAAQALGHSSLVLHRRYGHLETAGIHAAVEKSWTDDDR
jgi:integrase